ncbi:murein hydrolase activator EnvC family protein [Sphingomonas sp. Leaf17]|uniref:murein hydrolase activator EnvC family protein n=1 Tax=Sphingomonas sp. Leaf17 TaxID=1735683 RepID=UPI000A48350C|nr:peptidoglycan DD-metalloendopeptidase family protein [Sphingomonas sp. Leaf17]
MTRGVLLAVTAAVLLTANAAAQAPTLADQQARLTEARRAANAATARAAALTQAARRERTAAGRAQAEERALAGQVAAAQARVAAAAARAAMVDRLLADRRAGLGQGQAPVARLLAALQSLARRPAVAAIVQPGSVDDLVHVRAVLGGVLPVVRARTAQLRGEVARIERLHAAAAAAAATLRRRRARLEADRLALARTEAAHRQSAERLGRGAMSESDRALAMGERARDLVDALALTGSQSATAADLVRLPGPIPRPLRAGTVPPPMPPAAYRLPVAGRLVTGLDEVSAAGVRARGLSFAVAPGARVVAPAGGVVRFARTFRGYGVIVVIDHGDGWTTLLTGLSRASVESGQAVTAGAAVGLAATGDDPQVTVELRRRGRPVDIVALLG